MAYEPAVYRSSGGNQLEVVSSGRILIESNGEIDVASGGRLEIAGTAFISSGGAVVLTSAISKGNIATTGTVSGAGGFTSTGASFSSTGSGTAAKFDAVTSTGTGAFNAITSSGTCSVAGGFTSTGASFTSTGSGTAAKFDAVISTGIGTFDSITTTGGVATTIQGGVVGADRGFSLPMETLTSASSIISGYGVTHLTASTALTMPLAVPVANIDKWITVVTTAATVTITSSSGTGNPDIGGSTQISITTGTLLSPSWIHLIGRNSTSWRILGMSSNVSVS